MSIQARQHLVNSPNTIFQNDSDRADFLDVTKTRTELVALVLELIGKGHILEFTAVNTDHHNDECLGVHCHHDGDAADVWPLVSTAPGDYADASSPQMKKFIHDLMASPWTYQCGLAGSAQILELCAAAGFPGGFPTDTNRLFEDDGADHIHMGAQFVK